MSNFIKYGKPVKTLANELGISAKALRNVLHAAGHTTKTIGTQTPVEYARTANAHDWAFENPQRLEILRQDYIDTKGADDDPNPFARLAQRIKRGEVRGG